MWAQFMLTLYRCGRRADALLAYLQVRDVLGEETGMEPGQKLRDLHQAVLGEDPALDPEIATEERGRRNAAIARMLPPALGDFSGQQAELAEIEAVLRGDRAARPSDRPMALQGLHVPGPPGSSVRQHHFAGQGPPQPRSAE
ncbi:BTAD domain-containing putative transcriptional regulator [Streptomyces sp. M10(2022)]